MREVRGAGLDAVVINASGCGTTVKDYGHMFRGEALAADAATIAGLARDVTELMAELGLDAGARRRGSASPITPPARCSTGSRSGPSRRRC